MSNNFLHANLIINSSRIRIISNLIPAIKVVGLNNRGMSLIGVMVSSVILGVIMLGTMSFFNTAMQGQKHVEQKFSLAYLNNDIHQLLSKSGACTQTFLGKSFTYHVSLSPDVYTDVTTLKNTAGSGVYYTYTDLTNPNTKYDNNNIKIMQFTLSKYIPDNTPTSASDPNFFTGTAKLKIDYETTQTVSAVSKFSRELNLTVKLKNCSGCPGAGPTCEASCGGLATEDRKIFTCTAAGVSSGDSFWSATSSNDGIYYTGGKVGIGTISPSLKLNVKDSDVANYSVASFTSSNPAGSSIIISDPNTTLAPGVGAVGNSLTLWSNAVERVRIDAAGKVGIGTATPVDEMTLVKNWNSTTAFRVSNNDLGNAARASVLLASNSNVSELANHGSNYMDSGLMKPNAVSIASLGANGIGIGGNGPLRLYTGGTTDAFKRIHIATNGYISIGNFTPTAPLHLFTSGLGTLGTFPATIGNANIRLDDGTVSRSLFLGATGVISNSNIGLGVGTTSASSLFLGTNNATRVTIDSSGNVGVGTTSPSSRLTISEPVNSPSVLKIESSGTGSSNIEFDRSSGITWTLSDVGDDSFRIIRNGNVNWPIIKITPTDLVSIDNPFPTQKLDVVGNIKTSGCLYYASSSLGTCVSDERIKKDIHSFNLGLESLLGISPVLFKYNGLAGFKDDGKEQLGVIAQEVEKKSPELVKKQLVQLHKDDPTKTEIKAVDYGAFIYIIINSIKELYYKVKADNEEIHNMNMKVQEKIIVLEKENLELKTKMKKIEQENNDIRNQLKKIEEMIRR